MYTHCFLLDICCYTHVMFATSPQWCQVRCSGSSSSCVLERFGAKDLGELREIPGALDEKIGTGRIGTYWNTHIYIDIYIIIYIDIDIPCTLGYKYIYILGSTLVFFWLNRTGDVMVMWWSPALVRGIYAEQIYRDVMLLTDDFKPGKYVYIYIPEHYQLSSTIIKITVTIMNYHQPSAITARTALTSPRISSRHRRPTRTASHASHGPWRRSWRRHASRRCKRCGRGTKPPRPRACSAPRGPEGPKRWWMVMEYLDYEIAMILGLWDYYDVPL
jgi:hypothetical protein